ncbi:teichoic acid D-Ala incorporation-associated protein DltX [Liquorilactobacillus uvarum]|nr:teichoic acid D-Ala incorporation-associated protein DltX [Liquorilactobacillus uvarum]
MNKKQAPLIKNEILRFVLRTALYFAIMLVLVYLYNYSGINGPHFIYNEF